MTISGGTLSIISVGQTDANSVVLQGASLTVDSGGTASNTSILGSETVLSGGSDDGALILGGGVQLVQSGGVVSNAVISGGTLEVEAGGTLAGTADFAGGGTLVIEGGAPPSATIGGFVDSRETIDLASLAFASGGSAVLTSGNVLQVTEGNQTVSLNLDPSQNYAGHGFTLASDGQGGTAIVDPVTSFTVTSEGSETTGSTTALNGAIRTIDTTTGDNNYTITIGNTIDLTTNLLAIDLQSGSTLTISGGGNTLDGEGDQRGFLVYSGMVTISALTITSAQALGGAGGGGAGLGGGLFVASATHVTLSDVPSSMTRRRAAPAGPAAGITAPDI